MAEKIYLKCQCGKELEIVLQECSPGQEGDKFVTFCPNPDCRKRWELKDCTSEYEENLMNGIILAENGEYEENGEWFYADGKTMEK